MNIYSRRGVVFFKVICANCGAVNRKLREYCSVCHKPLTQKELKTVVLTPPLKNILRFTILIFVLFLIALLTGRVLK